MAPASRYGITAREPAPGAESARTPDRVLRGGPVAGASAALAVATATSPAGARGEAKLGPLTEPWGGLN